MVLSKNNMNAKLDLLIIGAGPVGLTAALEAKRLGLSVRVIDCKTQRSIHDSRALGIHPRVMELLEIIQKGAVTTEITKNSFLVQGVNCYLPKEKSWFTGCFFRDDEKKHSDNDNDNHDDHNSSDDHNHDVIHLNYQDANWGDTDFPGVYFLPQYETERILEETLNGMGVHVEYGVSLENIVQLQETEKQTPTDDTRTTVTYTNGGVIATLLCKNGINNNNDEATEATTTTTTKEDVPSQWILGADGGRSKTRELVGIEMNHTKSEVYFLVADLVLKGEPPLAFGKNSMHNFFSPKGVILLLPLPGTNSYRLIGPAPPGNTNQHHVELNETFFEELLFEWTGKKFIVELGSYQTIFEITHGSSKLCMNQQCNVMLVGDAYQLHHPLNGQGMNLGIQDAVTLVSKLAWAKRVLLRMHDDDEAGASTSHSNSNEEKESNSDNDAVARATRTTAADTTKNTVETILGLYHSERQALGQELIQSLELSAMAVATTNPMLQFLRNQFLRSFLPSDMAKNVIGTAGRLESSYSPTVSFLIWGEKKKNKNKKSGFICHPGQRVPNIRLEDGSHLHSYIGRVRHTWVFLNFPIMPTTTTQQGSSGSQTKKSHSNNLHSNQSNSTVVSVVSGNIDQQVSAPSITEQAYTTPQVLLVRPDQFVAGIGNTQQELLERLKQAGIRENAIATM